VTASRIRRGRRRLVAATALLTAMAALATVSACSAGINTQTSNQVPAVSGANADGGPDGKIALRDLVVVYNASAGYPRGGSAPLSVRVFNDGQTAIRLVGVDPGPAARTVMLVDESAPPTTEPPATTEPPSSAPPSAGPTPTAEAGSPTPSPPSGRSDFGIEIAPYSYEQLVPGKGKYLQLVDLAAALAPGSSVRLTFQFGDGSTIAVTVPFGLPTAPVERASAEVGGHE
jgi:hypothetical protein